MEPTPAGVILGKYKLGRLLGRGSFAKVYQAHSITDGTAVAVKIMDKARSVEAGMESRIVREVTAMRSLQHPNILKIYEIMATKSKIYLIIELAKGGELFTKISRRGRLTEAAARRYFQQLVSALLFCHQNGVAHRDMKPQNLLLDQDGNLKVSDFGLSALPDQLKNGLLHTACGTPAYTAPEVVSRKGYDGEKADAWSCGVILFVFLSGFLPFDDSNLVTMYRKIHRRDYQFPSWISRPARSVISQLLDPNPNKRMSIEALMESAWFKKSTPAKKLEHASSFDSDMESMKVCEYGSAPLTMNAFDIISMSSGLDLSGLFFEAAANKKEKRFMSRASAEITVEKMREVGEKLGYGVERGKVGSIRREAGRVVLLVEVSEVAPSLLLVEVQVVDGGEFEELKWEIVKAGLEDIVVSWEGSGM
ncbi:CBL-interacting serine/threonine-protein kinase 7 [Vitis vinifera]|uniref:non-specific serine/threonine protein kinase n=2 Tax=Vitis vinifera TaxID=29760 RepID=A0A438F7A5_VITVI|nr:CBL-interacting serine/threonine-protein kinase 7 [Vitis vinifera]